MKKQKNILYNNKGISLASVLVTVILMIIILTSIMYSNSRTNEIKEAMLINSDIEELTKKVEMYYLEKGTVPLYEDNYSNYNYKTTQNGNDVIYYRLQISLLDNLNLNNKENIQTNNLLTENDQWYVINKQTHTIYFMKCLKNGEAGVPQTAAYSNQYSNIISQAEANGVFDTTGTSSIVDNTIGLTPVKDSTSDVSGGLAAEEHGNENGDNTVPEEGAGSGVYSGVFGYVGYGAYNWTLGDKATNLVLHYDGEYNTLSEKNVSHSNSTSTWSDLSGYGNDGTIVTNSSWITRFNNSSASYNLINCSNNSNRTITSENFGTNYINLAGDRYVVADNYNYTASGITTGRLQGIPTGSSKYTMEIVFKYNPDYMTKEGNTAKGGLIGMGTYNNNNKVYTNDEYLYYIKKGTSNNVRYKGELFVTNNAWNKAKSEKNGVMDSALEIFNRNDEKANALKINGTGLSAYYWNNDTNTNNLTMVNNKIYTATVRYDGNGTEIWVNGSLKSADNNNKKPDTVLRELTIGATNMKTTVYYRDHITSNYDWRCWIYRRFWIADVLFL